MQFSWFFSGRYAVCGRAPQIPHCQALLMITMRGSGMSKLWSRFVKHPQRSSLQYRRFHKNAETIRSAAPYSTLQVVVQFERLSGYRFSDAATSENTSGLLGA
jgi:hypothetical protein